jgi:hypothetical protein
VSESRPFRATDGVGTTFTQGVALGYGILAPFRASPSPGDQCHRQPIAGTSRGHGMARRNLPVFGAMKTIQIPRACSVRWPPTGQDP